MSTSRGTAPLAAGRQSNSCAGSCEEIFLSAGSFLLALSAVLPSALVLALPTTLGGGAVGAVGVFVVVLALNLGLAPFSERVLDTERKRDDLTLKPSLASPSTLEGPELLADWIVTCA